MGEQIVGEQIVGEQVMGERVAVASEGLEVWEEVEPVRVRLRIGAVTRVVVWTIVWLIVMHVLLIVVVSHTMGHGRLLGLSRMFDLDQESNIPTYFSGLLMLASAAAVGMVAATQRRLGDRSHRRWWALAVIMALMSVDEMSQLHETGNIVLESVTAGEMVAGRLWVLTAVPVVLLVVAYFLRFVLSLPAATRRGYVIAGALFVAGAAGVEVIEGMGFEAWGAGAGLSVIVLVQEALEMTAIAIFLVVTLRHAATSGARLDVRLGDLAPA